MLKSERGFIANYLLAFSFIVIFVFITAFLALAFGIQTKSHAFYQWVGAAMDFAVRSAHLTEWEPGREVTMHPYRAHRAFMRSLAGMIDAEVIGNTLIPRSGSDVPGVVTVESFRALNAGDVVPGKDVRVEQPGYWVELRVPVFKGTLPVVGDQYLQVTMSYFGAVGEKKLEP
jgi:hypothetical protein